MSIIESITRRPLPVKVQEYATTAFAVLLISFMLFVSFKDIQRFKLFRAMFQQENQVGGSAEEAPSTPTKAPGTESVPATAR